MMNSSDDDGGGGAVQWLSMVSAVWLQAVIGTNSNFPAYSSQLKRYLSLSQLHLNSLAFASDAGKLFGWIAGVVARRAPLWLVLVIGSSLGFLSYGLQFLSISDDDDVSPSSSWSSFQFFRSFPLFFLLNILAGNSICWINTFCYNLVIRNFPFHQQVAVGITNSYQALTSKIYAVVVGELFISAAHNIKTTSTTLKSYLLLQSLLPLLVATVALLLMLQGLNPSLQSPSTKQPEWPVQKRCRLRFVGMFVVTTATGVYAVFSSLSPKLWRMFPYSGVVFTSGLLLMPMAIPAGLVIGKTLLHRLTTAGHSGTRENDMEDDGGGGSSSDHVSAEIDHEMVVAAPEGSDDGGKAVEGGGGGGGVGVMVKEEIGVRLMVQRAEFWLHVFVYFFGPTIGMVYLSNLGQITESRTCYETSSLVSLSSSFTFFGRLLPSFLDYFFSRSKYLPSRPAFLVLLMAPMSASFFLLLDKSHTVLYISTAAIGICSGAIISIAVSISSELFGPKHFGVNHNIVIANIPIGSLIFGYLAAQVYESHKPNGHSKCMGMQCYRRTFLIWGQLSGFGVFLSFLLYFRTKEFYSRRSQALY